MPYHKNCIDEMADGPANGADAEQKCFGCAIEKNECECVCSYPSGGGGGGGSCGYVSEGMCAACVGRHILRDKEEMGRLASHRLAAMGVSTDGLIFDATSGALSLAMEKMAEEPRGGHAPWAWEVLCEVRNVLGFPGRRQHRPSCGLVYGSEGCPCVLQVLGQLLSPHIKPAAAQVFATAHRRMDTLHAAHYAARDARAELERVTEELREREHVLAEEQRLNGEALAHARAFWAGPSPYDMEVEEVEREEEGGGGGGGGGIAERLEGGGEEQGE